ncbi:MAG: hypothetical protein QM811_08135 [Pirellulales bacterium]
MSSIAGEEIVAAGTADQNFDPAFARAGADQQHVQRGGIGLGFVQVPQHLGQLAEHIWADRDFVQRLIQMLGDQPSIRQIVGEAVAIGCAARDGVALQPALSGEGDDRA